MKSTLKQVKLLNASAIAFAVTLASSSYSYAATNTRNTYVGLDVVYNSMKLKKDYGGNIFSKKMAPGLNFSVGHMFHENFGAELGIEVEKKMKRTETIPAPQMVAGVAVPQASRSESYTTKIKQQHPYIGAIAKYNLFNNTFVSLMLGGALSKIKAEYFLFEDGAPGNLAPDEQITRTFSKTKLIPLIRGQLEQKISNNFSIKALITWKNSSSIKMNAKEANAPSILKLKDSFNIGVGIKYYIF